jgi:uncharacterized protein (UPF0276 family)
MQPHQTPTSSADSPFGLGLRSPHLDAVMSGRPAVGFFEIHPENYFLDKKSLAKIARIRGNYRLSLHAVGLSLGSHDGVDEAALAALRDLTGRLDPFLVSDHLSFSKAGGAYLNDLLPIPYTREALDVFSRNVARVQSVLKRQILIENPSAYIAYGETDYDETEFLRALVMRTGCGLLLDVNNVFVSANNLGFDPENYLNSFPMDGVKEIHLAGHHRRNAVGKTLLIDDHGSAVSDEVLSLYARTIARARDAVTLIEWDSNIPAFEILLSEQDRAVSAARPACQPAPAPALSTLQDEIGKALLSNTEEVPQIRYSGHFSVYRNNVRESLTCALRGIYGGTEALVGADFFRQTALQYIEAHPPSQPSIASYGETLPDFLATLASCEGLPYLADVAKLEWHLSRASLHEVLPAMSADALASCAGDDPVEVTFMAQPGLSYLNSAYPVDHIWDFARRGGKGEPPRIDEAPAALEIAPGNEGAVVRRLDMSEFSFRSALASGACIGAAADTVLKSDPLFVLFAALRSILSDGIFIACRKGQPSIEEIASCPC